jgi:hypothetical protein
VVTGDDVARAATPTDVKQVPGTDSVPVGTCDAYQITVTSAGAPSPSAPLDVSIATDSQTQNIPGPGPTTTPAAPTGASSFCNPTANNGPTNPGSTGFVGTGAVPENPQMPSATSRSSGGPGADTVTGEFTADGSGIVTVGVASSAPGSFTVTAFVETVAENERVDGVPCAKPQNGTQGQTNATMTSGSATQEPCAASSKVFTPGYPGGVRGIGATPQTATNVTGQVHAVMVTVCSGTVAVPSDPSSRTPATCDAFANSQPIPGATVTEQIAGVNVGTGSCAQTDQRGQARCTYQGFNAGSDTLTFSVNGAAGPIQTTAHKTYVTGRFSLDADGANDVPSLTPGCDLIADASTSFISGSVHRVCGKVTRGGPDPTTASQPVPNQEVGFVTSGVGGFVDCASGTPTNPPTIGDTDANGYVPECVGSQTAGQQLVAASVGFGADGKTASVTITWTGTAATTTTSTTSSVPGPGSGTTTTTQPAGSLTGQGYTEVASDGGIFVFGNAGFFGSAGSIKLNKPVVGMAWDRTAKGYLLVASDGGVFAFGDAIFLGSMGGARLNSPVVGIRVTPSGRGYYLVASDGGIFSFGDAGFFGSTGGIRLNKPVVAMAATPIGKGYWLAGSDGGLFSFGDAPFLGSMGSTKLNSPVVGLASTSTGNGYWLAASDGGVFSFGDAAFLGSGGSIRLSRPVVGMMARPTDKGYWLVASDGGIFSFGDAAFQGSMGGKQLNSPMVGGDAPPG